MEQIIEKRERSLTPDICKGIAILLVVWGHVLQQGLLGIADIHENPVVKLIYSFHMPLFVLISGYFFYASQKKRTIKEIIVQRSKNLLKIILIWNTIHFVVSLLFNCLIEKQGSFSIKSWWQAIIEGYWFLWAMLFCTITVGFIVKSLPIQFWILGFVAVVPLALISPCRWVILSVYPFYIAGFLFHKWIEEGKKIPVWLKYCSLPVFVVATGIHFSGSAVGNSEWMYLVKKVLGYLKGSVGLTDIMLQVRNVVLYYILGISGSVSVIILVDVFVRKVKKNVVWNYIGKLGQFSLQIYILQRVLLELILGKCYGMLVRVIGKNPIVNNISMFTWVYSFLISVICIYLLYLLISYVLKGKVSCALFGR